MRFNLFPAYDRLLELFTKQNKKNVAPVNPTPKFSSVSEGMLKKNFDEQKAALSNVIFQFNIEWY